MKVYIKIEVVDGMIIQSDIAEVTGSEFNILVSSIESIITSSSSYLRIIQDGNPVIVPKYFLERSLISVVKVN
jgi:hypothetical protein